MTEKVSPKELNQRVDALIKEIESIPDDPETVKAGEKLHRELSFLSPEDLLKLFAI
jgi:hypothetical protein